MNSRHPEPIKARDREELIGEREERRERDLQRTTGLSSQITKGMI